MMYADKDPNPAKLQPQFGRLTGPDMAVAGSGPSPMHRALNALEATAVLTQRVRELVDRMVGAEAEEMPAAFARIDESGALGSLAMNSEAALHQISAAHRALDRLSNALS